MSEFNDPDAQIYVHGRGSTAPYQRDTGLMEWIIECYECDYELIDIWTTEEGARQGAARHAAFHSVLREVNDDT